MRKIICTALFLSFFMPVFSQVEDITKEVLKAYQERDVELLKKHASGIFKYAISDSYFSDKSIQSDLKVIDQWDGKIRDVRYTTGDVMGSEITLASVYYADHPENEDEICVVTLSTMDKTKWVMFAAGVATEEKAVYEEMSTSLEASEQASTKEAPKNFSIEMANGDNLVKVKEEQIKKYLNELNEDNFFMILSKDEGFMQAAHSDQGLILQYSENGEMKEAEDYLTTEQAFDVMKRYFNGKDWKEGNNWIEPSY